MADRPDRARETIDRIARLMDHPDERVQLIACTVILRGVSSLSPDERERLAQAMADG